MSALRASTVALVAVVAIALPSAAFAAPPANDDFGNAVALTTQETFVEGTNVEATKEPDEPEHAGNAGGSSIWYRWTAPVGGRATVSTCDSDFNTLLGVYTGDSLAQLIELAANDDSCGSQSSVSFEATAGGVYRIAVDGFDGATGQVALFLRIAPPNDDFADAQGLGGDTGSVQGTTLGSSVEDGEPYHWESGWNSVWFTWTAPSTGWATFETCGIGTTFDTVLAVYTGSVLGELSEVAGNDDGCGTASRVHFQAAAGTLYRIAVAGFDGITGSFALTWNRNGPPPSPTDWPRVLGIATDGETLTATDGQWAGDQPFTYAYAWGRCDRDFEHCGLIAGAGARTYTIKSEDVGHRLYVRVTASNSWGSNLAYSEPTALIAARRPSSVLPPTVTGQARPGGLLVATGGTWMGTTPFTFTYQWQSCNASGENCADLAGQTGQLMQVPGSASGSRIRVVVTAANAAGSAAAASEPTPLVRRPQAPCVVPRLRGRTLRAAKAAIVRAACTVGGVRRAYSARVRRGRVISQTPRAGARLRRGAKVSLVLSKGRKR